MLIIVIAWLYVVVLMALTETGFVAGVTTFLLYGGLPITLLAWLLGTPERRRRRLVREARAAGNDHETSAGASGEADFTVPAGAPAATTEAPVNPAADARSAPPSGRTGHHGDNSRSAPDR